MKLADALRTTVAALIAAVPFLLGPGLRAAEGAAVPPAAAAKALLDEHLADWDDPAARQAVLRTMHDVFPARLADLEEVVVRNRDEAHEIADRLIDQSHQLMNLKEGEPREYERLLRLCRLEDECLGLARKARTADAAAREPLVAELKKKLAEAFDAKQEAMQRRALDLLGDREAEW
jgi:hypothetical protein